MLKIGVTLFVIALIGFVSPFIASYLDLPWPAPELSIAFAGMGIPLMAGGAALISAALRPRLPRYAAPLINLLGAVILLAILLVRPRPRDAADILLSVAFGFGIFFLVTTAWFELARSRTVWPS